MDKLDVILGKLECMDGRMEAIDEKISAMDTRMEAMDEKISAIENRMGSMEERIGAMDKRMDTMDNDIKSIKLTLENEIRRDIMRVAEGHLDLSRNLKYAIRSNNEYEMLTIKVNMLENDVRELNQRISISY